MTMENDPPHGDKTGSHRRDGDAPGGGDASGSGNILAGEQEEDASDEDGTKRNEAPSSPKGSRDAE